MVEESLGHAWPTTSAAIRVEAGLPKPTVAGEGLSTDARVYSNRSIGDINPISALIFATGAVDR